MGKAASLFYSTNDPDQTLHRRVRPTEQQQTDQQIYWNDLAEYLKHDLAERTGCAIGTWLQGSYKFGTQIRPARKGGEFDIDLGVYFKWNGVAEEGSYTAAALKNVVQTSLSAYAADVETDALRVTPPKEFCARIIFSPDFHIDVPAYHEWDDVRTLASASDGFRESDPWAIYNWWINKFDDVERDRARRMVRYLKMWAALRFDPKTETPPSSILLTVLVADAYHGSHLSDVSGDDELFSTLVKRIATRLDQSSDKAIPNPANTKENLNRLGGAYMEFRAKLGTLIDTCEAALDAPDKTTAAETWSEAFEHFFPIPEEAGATAIAEARALVPAFVPEVEVTTELPSGREAVTRNFAVNVPKDAWLRFRVTNYADLPPNSLVRWTVRNEGAVAEAENDLGHFSGFGPAAREHAEYHGRHFMDVTVISSGRVIGRRRVPISILGSSLAAKVKRLLGGKRR